MTVEQEQPLQRTPLYEVHQKHRARIIDFLGWEMPLSYEGSGKEHLAVRKSVGLFDVSHMGRFEIEGPDAVKLINMLTTNNVRSLVPNKAQYSTMCNENGGVIDDLLVYKEFDDKLLMVVNAGNRTKDLNWINSHKSDFNVEVRDVSDQTALLALQGPKALEVLSRLADINLEDIAYYHFNRGNIADVETLISRNGYTGEDGFELWLPAEKAKFVWQMLMEVGEPEAIKPCGLGARDTLRLEVGFPLYGHELTEDITPLEAGLGWATKLDKGDFIGREALIRQALVRQKERGLKKRLVGLKMQPQPEGTPVPRQGFTVLQNKEKDGKKVREKVGELASGAISPSLKVGIATGFLERNSAGLGADVQIDIRGVSYEAQVTGLKFYTNGSARTKH